MPRLERALKETQKAYQIGKYSYQEWSVVQQEVLDTQLALVDARLKAHNNMVELERLTGLSLLSRKVAQ
jgi:cobalt-zinc-cadmium efflux system outer membrane protein